MRHKFLAALLAAVLLLGVTGCGGSTPAQKDDTLNILTTTYPLYLFTTAITEGAENVKVTQLVKEETSCLHDYTLSVNDMKAIEKADVIILNGAGLEVFMDDALALSKADVIDCSEGIELLAATGHHDHGHEHDHSEDSHFDPHFWLDPDRAAQMMESIAAGLGSITPENAALYSANLDAALSIVDAEKLCALATGHTSLSSVCSSTDIITFHDGFRYFAEAFDLNLLKAIEEEEGAEASAAEIREMVTLIREYTVPALFTEANGSDSTARAIARETGVDLHQLNMVMAGEGSGIQPYVDAMIDNLQTVAEALK